MDIESSLNLILHNLRRSNLHFSAQETPHSLYLSIRKKFLNQNCNILYPPIPSSLASSEEKCAKLENHIEALTREYEKEISDHEKVAREKDDLAKSKLKSECTIDNLEVQNKLLECCVNLPFYTHINSIHPVHSKLVQLFMC